MVSTGKKEKVVDDSIINDDDHLSRKEYLWFLDYLYANAKKEKNGEYTAQGVTKMSRLTDIPERKIKSVWSRFEKLGIVETDGSTWIIMDKEFATKKIC